jgi:hypothetical protein
MFHTTLRFTPKKNHYRAGKNTFQQRLNSVPARKLLFAVRAYINDAGSDCTLPPMDGLGKKTCGNRLLPCSCAKPT